MFKNVGNVRRDAGVRPCEDEQEWEDQSPKQRSRIRNNQLCESQSDADKDDCRSEQREQHPKKRHILANNEGQYSNNHYE